MKRWLHKIEVIVDKAIPPCLIVLLIVIVLDLGFHDFVERHHLRLYILAADYIVISIFIVDLVFKYMRTRHIPKFLRIYWLDILAVFPFFLVFRVFEVAAGAFSAVVSESTQTIQAVLHEGLEIEKEGSKVIKEGSRIAREAEKLSKLHRSTRFMRFLRPILRLPRFFKAVPRMIHFYERPTGEHHVHEFMPRHGKRKH